jgi:hypothetical protein
MGRNQGTGDASEIFWRCYSDRFFGAVFPAYGQQGFLYSNGSITTIDVPGSNNTTATGINGAGEIVGWSVYARSRIIWIYEYTP